MVLKEVIRSPFSMLFEALSTALDVEMPKEEYLNRLSDINRSNVLRIVGELESQQEKLGGMLVAVGGTVRERDPNVRKDIDLSTWRNDGISVDTVNNRIIQVIQQSPFFVFREGTVLNENDDTKKCFYLYPKNRGTTIHLILSKDDDESPECFAINNKLTRRRYSVLCYF